MSQLFTEQARRRAEELGVAAQVKFIHGDAAGYVSEERVDVAVCIGATGIGRSDWHYRASTAKLAPRKCHSHRRVLLAALAAHGRCRQRMPCQFNLRISQASGPYLVFRKPWLQCSGNGFG